MSRAASRAGVARAWRGVARVGVVSVRASASGGDDGRARRASEVAKARRPTHREKLGHDWTYDAQARAKSATARDARASVGGDDGREPDRWLSAEESDGYEYRGAWLATSTRGGDATPDPAFEERVRAMKVKAGRYRDAKIDASDFEPGGTAYEAFLGEYVLEHVRLSRLLARWRANFLIRFDREPAYEDMPSSIRKMELNWISLGFKIRAIEKI